MRAFLALLVLSGCGDQGPFDPDASTPDAGAPDAGTPLTSFQPFEVEATNEYAVSIFNVAVSVIDPLDGGTAQRADAGATLALGLGLHGV